MGRPPTRPKEFKDGFYIEVCNKGSVTGVKVRRNTKQELIQAIKEYIKSKKVIILGEYRDGKRVNENPISIKDYM